MSTVVDDSPAFKADILPGDILVSVNGQSVSQMPDLMNALRSSAGQSVDVVLIRNGQQVQKTALLQ